MTPTKQKRSGLQAPWWTTLGALALAVALWGCPSSNPQGDGGTDAGGEVDAGYDAGTPAGDAGVDAGAPDAGLPPELKILQVLPPRAPTTGGISVTLQGSGFVRGVADTATGAKKKTTLKFGANPAQDFTIIDDGTIDARVPPGKAGLANITIENDNGVFVCDGCFTFYEEVFLKTANPKDGPRRGGTQVTVTGGGFTPDVQVLFGNQSSPGVTVTDSKTMTVVAPRANQTGPVDLTVYSKNGVDVLRNVFRYYEDTRVSSIAPLTGPLGGGTQVVITGKGFDGATSVTFGGVAAASFTVDSPTQITAVTPAGAATGKVPVTITTPRDAWTVRDGFYYEGSGALVLGGAFPHVGPAAGGNTVTLFGEGFDPQADTVLIGGKPAPIVSGTAHELVVTVPARGTSPRVVSLSVSDGAQTSTVAGGYTWGIALADIAPRTGPQAGGTAANVTGVDLPDDAEVFIGALQATVQGTPTETTVSVLTPKGQGGAPTAVWVREASDPENEAVLEDVFTFEEALSVGRVQPDRGAIAGGTLVSVLGSGFGEGTLVKFGPYVAKDIKVIDVHTLTCRTPKADGVGSVDITVKRVGANDDTLPGGFSYFDPRSISGGLSGGPLTGTLNVSVLDSSPGFYGAPVPLATVMLGVDSFTPFQGPTDQRGQITFSDPSLVKAQTVTVYKDGYETTTVSSVNAENLTVFIARTGGDGSPAPPPPGPPPSIISGHVIGFKAPRPLGPNESLEARVFVSQTSFYEGPPFRGPPNRAGQKWLVTKDGGEYLLATRSGLHATYAILGVSNSQTKAFEPYLMGVKRGITVSPDNPATNQDIVLDMHLDMSVPVTVDSPLSFDGSPAPNELYAWLDLGAEGFIPNPSNWAAGTGSNSSLSSTATMQTFPSFPQLDGQNFVFMNFSYGAQGIPYSVYFRRQPGDLTQGVTIGPMLPTPTLVTPSQAVPWNGTVQWTVDPGPTPDIHQILILKPTLMGLVTLWSMVLPGNETQVTLPPIAVKKLHDEEAQSQLFIEILSSRSPKFSYNQWTYGTLSGVTWSSYTIAVSDSFHP